MGQKIWLNLSSKAGCIIQSLHMGSEGQSRGKLWKALPILICFLFFQVFNVKATTFLSHLLLQPISIYCNGVVTQQVQGLDEGRSRQLHEGLHDTCGFVVSSTTQVIHWHHMLARTILKDSPGPSYRPWLVIRQYLHATYWWCSSICEREEFMTIISNVSFVWMGLRWCNRTSWSAFGKKVLCALVCFGDAFRIDRPKRVQQRPIALFFLGKTEHWLKKMVQLLAALADLKKHEASAESRRLIGQPWVPWLRG